MEKKDSDTRLFLPSGCLTEQAAMDFVMGRLTAGEQVLVRSHLDHCEFCSMAIQGSEEYLDRKDESDYSSLLEELKNTVNQKVTAAEIPLIQQRNTGKTTRIWTLAAVAAGMLLIFGVYQVIRIWQPNQQIQTAQQVLPEEKESVTAENDAPPVPGNAYSVQKEDPSSRVEEKDKAAGSSFLSKTIPVVTEDLVGVNESKSLTVNDYVLNQNDFSPTSGVNTTSYYASPALTYNVPVTDCLVHNGAFQVILEQAPSVKITGAEAESRHKSKKSSKQNLEAIPAENMAEIEVTNDSREEVVYTVVEEMPGFPGGQDSLNNHIARKLSYPVIAREQSISGTVFVGFTIDKKGKVKDVSVIKGIGGGCDEEAIRVVKGMPRWIPGKQGGKTVDVRITLPVKFILH